MFALSDVRHTAIHAIVFEILILKKLIKKREEFWVWRERDTYFIHNDRELISKA